MKAMRHGSLFCLLTIILFGILVGPFYFMGGLFLFKIFLLPFIGFITIIFLVGDKFILMLHRSRRIDNYDLIISKEFQKIIKNTIHKTKIEDIKLFKTRKIGINSFVLSTFWGKKSLVFGEDVFTKLEPKEFEALLIFNLYFIKEVNIFFHGAIVLLAYYVLLPLEILIFSERINKKWLKLIRIKQLLWVIYTILYIPLKLILGKAISNKSLKKIESNIKESLGSLNSLNSINFKLKRYPYGVEKYFYDYNPLIRHVYFSNLFKQYEGEEW